MSTLRNVPRSWYANALSRGRKVGKYHGEGADWIRRGKAVCGASITHPAGTLRQLLKARETHNQCQRCCAILEALGPGR